MSDRNDLLAGGPAQNAGLAPGNTLVALDGIRIQRDKLDDMLTKIPEGAETEIHAFRRDDLMRYLVCPRLAPADTCELRILSDQPGEIRRRQLWLGLPG
jgi:predicted metalloprotease with PDZ domain